MNQDKIFQDRLAKAKELVSQLHNNFPVKGKNKEASDDSTKHSEAYSKMPNSEVDSKTQNSEDYVQMRIRSLKYIGVDRGRSFGQVKRVLQKDFPEIAAQNAELLNQVIKDLIDDQYLDEYLCGKRIIKRHSGRAQKSKEYIKQLMYKQGISEAVINDLVFELPDDSVTVDNYRLIKQDEWDPSAPEKVMRHLASRGYSAGISRQIVQKWLNEV